MSVRIDVELDIFSGMPNPVWQLSAAQADAFGVLLAGLPPGAPRSLSGRLGYRGFIVRIERRAATRLVLVQSGIVQDTEGGRQVSFADPARGLERWLLQSAEPHVSAELFQVVERDLR